MIVDAGLLATAIRLTLAATAFSAALALPAAPQSPPVQPTIPVLQDLDERLPVPDLSGLPRLRFLTTTDFPPFNFLDPNGRLSGFHVDLARAVCAELGLADRCQIQALPWAELDAALARGDGEAIIAGLAISAETRARYLFTRPYLVFPARFAMRADASVGEPMADSLRGKAVGVVAGSAHELLLKDYFPAAVPRPFPDEKALFAALKEGAVEAAFADGMRIGFWLAGTEAAGCCRFAGGPYLAPEYLGQGLAIATAREQSALAQGLDHALHEVVARGAFAELYLRYFPAGFF